MKAKGDVYFKNQQQKSFLFERSQWGKVIHITQIERKGEEGWNLQKAEIQILASDI